MMKRIAILLLVALLFVVPSGIVLAAQTSGDRVIGENETINNDVTVFEGDLEIREGAVVRGDVTVFNGDTQLAGTVNGDLVMFNGDLEAEEGARIEGDCVLLNGSLEDNSAVGLNCSDLEGAALGAFLQDLPFVAPPVPTMPAMPEMPEMPEMPAMPEMAEPHVPPVTPPVNVYGESRSAGFFADLLGIVGSTLLLGFLAFITGAAFPTHLQRVQRTVRRKPVASGAVGLLTVVAAPSLALLLTLLSALLTLVCIGLLGFPLVLLLLFGLFAGMIMGWIAVGAWLGERLFGRKGRSVAATAALGTMLLTFGLGVLGLIPLVFGESIIAALILSLGLGAVALTQFGRRPYPPDDGEPLVREDEEKVSAVLETLHIDDEGEAPPSKA